MTDDLHNEIGKLHTHIAHVSHQVRDVKEGQEGHYRKLVQLQERVDVLERSVSLDINHLAAHEKEAEIYRSHLIEGFDRLSEAVDRLFHRFEMHDEEDREERKRVIEGQRKMMLSIVLAAITFFGTGFMLLWQTGVLA